jgi:hypothetical protein
MERFNPKKLNGVEGKRQHHIEISNRFTTSENSDTNMSGNYYSENNKISAKESLGYYKLKKH